MSSFERLKTNSELWICEPPASEAEIQKLVSHLGDNLPTDYLKLLRFCNGGNGDLASQPVLFFLWSASEAIEANRDYEIGELLPSYVMIGDDRANELFGFRVGTTDTKVYMIPKIVMSEEDPIVVAKTFAEFVETIGREYKETDA